MANPTIDLLTEWAVLSSSLTLIQNKWVPLFAQYKKGYDAAFTSVSNRLKDAPNGDRALIAIAAKIADIAVKPFEVYGAIASVALAGLSQIARDAIPANSARNLKAPSAASFSADLEGVGAEMFNPLLIRSRDIAVQAKRQRTMDAREYQSAKSLLLSSPIWYPPPKLQDGLVRRRIEEVLWCVYFGGLYQAGYASYQLRFLDPIVSYLMDEAFVSPSESVGWEEYPTPVSQGGPGDWLQFVTKTHRLWTWKLDEHTEKGWLTPMPVIPEKAKIQKAVNWTPPKASTFVAPTRSGTATVRIESVEMTLFPSLDWSDVPALGAGA